MATGGKHKRAIDTKKDDWRSPFPPVVFFVGMIQVLRVSSINNLSILCTVVI